MACKTSVQGSWEKKIVERVHNVRSASLRKRPSTEDAEIPRKRGRPKSCMSRYPPLSDICAEGNDDVCNERNLQMLCREMERDKPRKEHVLTLMRHTFTIRREYVLSETDEVSVATILDKYMGLTLPYAVSRVLTCIFTDVCIIYYTHLLHTINF